MLDLMLKELENVIRDGVTETEFTRCKEQLKSSYLLGMESSNAHMNAIGKCLLLQNEEYSIDTILSRIECVTMDDIARIIPQVLQADRMTVAAVGRLDSCEKGMRKIAEDWWKEYGQA